MYSTINQVSKNCVAEKNRLPSALEFTDADIKTPHMHGNEYDNRKGY